MTGPDQERPVLPVSTLLPIGARERLIRAAAVSNDVDPRARQKAIEITTNIIKSQYPQYFHLKEEVQP